MKLELTPEQQEEVAIAWLKQQQDSYDGYKKPLAVLFVGAHFAKWSWMDAIRYVCILCTKNYSIDLKYIIKDLKNVNAS